MTKALTPKVAKKQTKTVIEILRDDKQFDVISECVELYLQVKKGRNKGGWTPVLKSKMMFDILKELLKYTYPKVATLDNTDKGDKINLQLNIAGSSASNVAAGPVLDMSKINQPVRKFNMNIKKDPKSGRFIPNVRGSNEVK